MNILKSFNAIVKQPNFTISSFVYINNFYFIFSRVLKINRFERFNLVYSTSIYIAAL